MLFGCINLSHERCIYDEILTKFTVFLLFGGCICT
jgi:hypothetical protein